MEVKSNNSTLRLGSSMAWQVFGAWKISFLLKGNRVLLALCESKKVACMKRDRRHSIRSWLPNGRLQCCSSSSSSRLAQRQVLSFWPGIWCPRQSALHSLPHQCSAQRILRLSKWPPSVRRGGQLGIYPIVPLLCSLRSRGGAASSVGSGCVSPTVYQVLHRCHHRGGV